MSKRLSVLAIACCVAGSLRAFQAGPAAVDPVLATRAVPVITVAASRFRDLNRNGTLDPYEDWRLPAARRAGDLVARMTLEEKAGAMMHGTARSGSGATQTGYDLSRAERIVLGAHVTSLITRLSGAPEFLADQNNHLQEVAERSRLGIPLTISTDPRHHFQHTFGASVAAGGFSMWPETLGLAAIGDAAVVRRFGDIARQEYRAVGIAQALSPQADLATEPRWPRINGTFGEDPELARTLVQAYVEGFQQGSDGPGPESVATVVKHWVGYGAAVDGFDGHNYYGRFSRLSGALDVHIRPFEGAFAARVSGVMPTYTILEDVTAGGSPVEQVGGAFHRWLLTDLLRGTHQFDGVILSDWAVTNDCSANCREGQTAHGFADIAMPWGVESLDTAARFVKGVEAGVDQFGGTEDSQMLVAAVRSGRLPEARVDESVRRVMTQKFALGLFERPFVDVGQATSIVGNAKFRAEAEAAQRRSLVMLENRSGVLPLRDGARLYVHGVDPTVARAHGASTVDRVEEASVAVLRVATPFETIHPNHFFGSRQHEGRLDFREGDPIYDQIAAAVSARVPTVVVVDMDRPAILTNIRDKVQAIVVAFGVSDAALLDVLTGRAQAEGRLPFELPSSMADVEAQSPGLPHDTPKPLYPIGAGSGTAGSARRQP